jgi:hypothetical protein
LVRSGYGEFPPLDPAGYDDDASLPVKIAISQRTGNIIGITYGSRQETYSGYGVTKTLERPQVEYSAGELETIVQEELNGAL